MSKQRSRSQQRCRAALISAIALLLAAWPVGAQLSCPISYGATEGAKRNKLYLYFPTADDTTFPNYDPSQPVSPARAFSVAELTSYTGTASDLRNRVRDVVVDDYCEFSVQVIPTTISPPTTFARRAIVAIGTDANVSASGSAWGQADSVDINDATAVNFARVWAGTYQSTAGGAGGALNGANSTLDRWSLSVGGTAAHEAGHMYGLSHVNGEVVKAGEPPLNHHIMPRGALITDEDRAGFRRHFDDTSFSILAANLGLSIQTIHNWDFTNPNNVDAKQLRMEILSTQASLIPSWSYGGSSSPWINPTVSAALGTQTFKGTTYNRFQITWSIGQPWNNGASGTVPPAAKFHVGATFSGVDFDQPEPVIIARVNLLSAGGSPLTLSPRMFGYDTGSFDSSDGTFAVNFFNADNVGRPLLLTDLTVFELPRVVSIDSMVSGGVARTWQGLPILPWRTTRPLLEEPANGLTFRRLNGIEIRDAQRIPVARLAQGRHIFERYDSSDCTPSAGSRGDATYGPDVTRCGSGFQLDLFPATTVYIVATVVDPEAEHWDAAQNRFIVGPVESKLFYQVGGVHPDLNRNRIDDAIDIATGTSRDVDGNGVVDDVQVQGGSTVGNGWEISTFLGLVDLDATLPIEDGSVFGLRAGLEWAPRWAVEGEVAVLNTEDDRRNQGDVLHAGVNLLYHFSGSGHRLRPYISAGTSALLFRGFTSDESSAAFNLGLGLKARIGSQSGLRLEVRDDWAQGLYGADATQNWQVTGGLIYFVP